MGEKPRGRAPSKLAPAVLCVASVVIGVLLIAEASTLVLLPMAVDFALMGAFAFWLYRRSPSSAPVCIGIVYALTVFIYAVYPLAVYELLGEYYTPLNDARLFSEQPPPDTVTRIAWYYTVYLAFFIIGYISLCEKSSPRPLRLQNMDASRIWAVLVCVVLIRIGLIGAEAMLAQRSDDYLGSYLKYSHLPLIAQQLLGHADGIGVVISIATIAVACSQWRRYRWVIAIWLAVELLVLILGLGSRTYVALLCLSLLISYHFLHQQLSTKTMAIWMAALLFGFLALGLARAYQISGFTGVGVEVMAGSSEFESLFANAVDIDRLDQSGQLDKNEIAAAVYVGNFIGLIPRQFLPFEKIDLATWYVETYHEEYAKSGGGMAFGVIAESEAGAGLVDLVWRGLLVGLFFSLLDRILGQGQVSAWKFVFYVWVVSSSYQLFRGTTFGLVPLFIYRFLPAIAVMALVAELLRAASRPQKVAVARSDRAVHSPH